jgi:TRAP-type C4-dicarboxylate transport system permease small subunit
MILVMALQVFSRYVLGRSFMWSEELARYCLIWMTFMGAGYGVKNHTHIEMTAIYGLFPPIIKKFVHILMNIIAVGFYSYIIPDSIKFITYQQKIISTGTQMPMSYVFVIIPIGVSIMIIRLLIDTMQVIKTKNFSREAGGVEC